MVIICIVMNAWAHILSELKMAAATVAPRNWAALPMLIVYWWNLRRIFTTLEAMFTAWRAGQLPALPPAPPQPVLAAPIPPAAPIASPARAPAPERAPRPHAPHAPLAQQAEQVDHAAGQPAPPPHHPPAPAPAFPRDRKTTFFSNAASAVSGDRRLFCC